MAPPLPIPRILPPPTEPIPPGVRTAGRAGAILGTILCVLFCLAGDSAPTTESIDLDTDERKKGCLEGDGPPEPPTYFQLDDRGRAQGVEACLGPWSQQVDPRDPPPVPGFKTGMNRSHLLARRFGGLSINENIVPMWENANKSPMAKIENEVKRRIDAGERVYYVALPVYALPSHPQYKEYGDAPVYVSYYIASRSGVWSFVVPNIP